jgi:hypothetical protein
MHFRPRNYTVTNAGRFSEAFLAYFPYFEKIE